jgi:hypothetical protein
MYGRGRPTLPSTRTIAEVSDRLVDAIVGYGRPATIAAKVGEHVAADADHVTLSCRSAATSRPGWTNWNSCPGVGRARLISATETAMSVSLVRCWTSTPAASLEAPWESDANALFCRRPRAGR